MQNARLGSLTDLYIAGVLSAAEYEELYQALLASPAARERFDRQVEWHRVHHPERSLAAATDFLANRLPPDEIVSPPAVRRSGSLPARRNRAGWLGFSRRAWAGWSMGGALAVCMAAAGFVMVQRTRPLPAFGVPVLLSPGPVATLRHAANVQWLGADREIFVGETFGAAELNIAAGVFQLEFQRGARLVVQGPARLQLVSETEAFLHSGKITATVPAEAHGFKVTAPALAVTDLGTEFGVLAVSNAPAEVAVFSGIVEMTRPDMKPKRLRQGEAARVQGRSVQRIAANRHDYVFEEHLRSLEKEEQQSRFERWKSAAAALSSDPAALVHFTFEEQPIGARLQNAAVQRPRRTTGAISGTWGPGRWPAKRAVVFRSDSDRIRFNVPNTLTSLTYMAWLRVDQLTSVSNALAITESMQLGEVHWQIYRDGRVALSAHSGTAGTVDQTWDRGLSPPVFTAERLGQWTHLTSVYDSARGTINHYLNGEFISATPIKRPLPLKLGAVEIGNWGVRVDQPKWASLKKSGPDFLNRHWAGRIDEFALLARAMGADEVREYYRRGRVASGTLVAQTAP